MRKLTSLSFIIIFTCNILSQSAGSITILPQGNSIGELNGLGVSGLLNRVSNIGAINPAALSNFSNFSLGVSYQFATGISPAWFGDISYKKVFNFIPQSAGVIYPYKNFRLGLSMYQRYNGIMDLGPIPVTTIQNPDGTGEFVNFEERAILYNYSIAAAYTFEEIFNSISLSLGGRFDLDRMTYNSTPSSGINLSFNGYSLAAGTTIRKNYKDNKYLQLGLYYEMGIQLNGHSSGLLVTSTSDTLISNYVLVPVIAKFPARLKLDFDISIIPGINFLGSLSGIFWKDIDVNNTNEIEYAGSAVYKFNDLISSSFGFFYTRKEYSAPNYFPNPNDNLKVFFFTLGTVINFNNIIIDVSLADSHLLSGAWRKQTIGKVGIGYEF